MGYKYQLTLNNLLRYVNYVFSDVPIVYRPPHGINYRSTYGEEYRRILKLADGLKKLGIGPGDRVASLDWNTIYHWDLYWAVPGIGAALHTVNVRLAPEDIAYTINQAGDKMLIYHRDFAPLVEKLKPALKQVKYYVQISDGQGSVGKDPDIEDVIKSGEERELPELSEDQVATVLYTSGTTGRPKGAYFTHRQLVLHTLSVALAIVGFRGLSRGDCAEVSGEPCATLYLVPMFHVHAWGLPWVYSVVGWKQVLPGRFDYGHILRLIVEEKVKAMAGVPTILYMLVTHPDLNKYISEIKRLAPIYVVGGAALPKELAKKAAEAGFVPRSGYGMTETAPVVSLGFLKPTEKWPEDPERLYDLITMTGLPNPLSEFAVFDENDKPVPRDCRTAGELALRAPWITPEYIGDPEKTRTAWRNGWFHTGDAAVWCPDGRIKIVDRLKDVIKSGGEWISSLQLEDLIMTHPAVGIAAVVGLPHEKWGERPVAFIVPKPNAAVTPEDITSHLLKFVEAGKIPKWWLPDKVVIVNDLPMTGTGKIDKKALREKYRDLLRQSI